MIRILGAALCLAIGAPAFAANYCFDRVLLVNSQSVAQSGKFSPTLSYIDDSAYLVAETPELAKQLLDHQPNTPICVEALQLRTFSGRDQSPVITAQRNGGVIYIESVSVNQLLLVSAIHSR